MLLSTSNALKDASVMLARSKPSLSSTKAAVLEQKLTVAVVDRNELPGKFKHLPSKSSFVALSYFQRKSIGFVVVVFFNFPSHVGNFSPD